MENNFSTTICRAEFRPSNLYALHGVKSLEDFFFFREKEDGMGGERDNSRMGRFRSVPRAKRQNVASCMTGDGYWTRVTALHFIG